MEKSSLASRDLLLFGRYMRNNCIDAKQDKVYELLRVKEICKRPLVSIIDESGGAYLYEACEFEILMHDACSVINNFKSLEEYLIENAVEKEIYKIGDEDKTVSSRYAFILVKNTGWETGISIDGTISNYYLHHDFQSAAVKFISTLIDL